MKRLAIVRSHHFNEIMFERYNPLRKFFKINFYGTNNDFNKKVKTVKTYHNIFLRAIGLHYFQPGLYNELNKFNPNIINTIELYNYSSFISVKYAKEKKKKSIVFCWETIPQHPVFNRGLRKFFTKFVINNADYFQVATKKSKFCLLKKGVDENKILFARFGVNTKRFMPKKNQELRKKIGLNKKTILFVGRLTYEKGIITLIKAFKKIKNANLLIIGDGELRNFVEKEANNRNIFYVGKINFNEIHNYFNCADIFCVPSIPHKLWEEQYGEVFLQAMSSGLPVISTNSGAIPEIVSEKEGILITPLSINELRESINKLLSDDKLRKKMSINARNKALTEFNYIKTNKLLYKLYNKYLIK